MRTSFFPVLFVVAIAASNIKFSAAETNLNGRLRGKDDDIHKTAATQDNLIGIKEDERGWPLLSRGKLKNKGVTSVDEAIMKDVNEFMSPGKPSTKFTKKKVRAVATYATSSDEKWYKVNRFLSNAYGITMVTFFLFAAIVFGWRPFTN
ncbi:unnamed protein product [Peronospora destructor]|uniref:RxLR effector protein n=1 Tax=Peronospora destructor TaxID=86335 RepID=A0AAV0UWF4_9STRA|nr:unnamed protein product [Peronospora destructor]